MNITTVPTNKSYYNTVNSDKTAPVKNTNFKGYAITDDGNTYKQTNTWKLTGATIGAILPGIRFTIARLTGKGFKGDILALITTTISNTISCFGIGTIIDMIINKIRSNQADRSVHGLQEYFMQQQHLPPEQSNIAYQTTNYYQG